VSPANCPELLAFRPLSQDGNAIVWDVATGEAALRMQLLASVEAIAFLDGGSRLLVGGADGRIALYDVADGEKLREVILPRGLRALAVDPGEDRLRAIDVAGSLQVVTLPDLGQARPPDGEPQTLGDPHAGSSVLALSPDGRWLATVGQGRVALQDGRSLRTLFAIPVRDGAISKLAFDRDGDLLAIGGLEEDVTLWDLAAVRSALSAIGLDWDAPADWPPGRGRVPRSGRAHDLARAIAPPPPEQAGPQPAVAEGRDRPIAGVVADARLLSGRGSALAELGRWAEADAEFVEATRYGLDVFPWYAHALLQLHRDDIEGYRDTCARMLERLAVYEQARNPYPLKMIANICSLAPEAVADFERPLRWAEKALALDPKEQWSHEAPGRILYRAGRYEEAVRRLDEAVEILNRTGNAWHWLFLAMAHHHLGHTDEARAWLGKAEAWIDQELARPSGAGGGGLSWEPRLDLQILRREAAALIREGRPLYLPANVFRDDPVPPGPIRPPGR
jgi:tetratricopeptide (TPR) repeat protein